MKWACQGGEGHPGRGTPIQVVVAEHFITINLQSLSIRTALMCSEITTERWVEQLSKIWIVCGDLSERTEKSCSAGYFQKLSKKLLIVGAFVQINLQCGVS